MKVLHIITFVLLAIGGANWGLIGFFDFNLVSFLFGDMTLLTRAVYGLVGVSTVLEIFMHPKYCKVCDK